MNLFSSFNPHGMMAYTNMGVVLFLPLMFPSNYWVSPGELKALIKLITSKIAEEVKMVFSKGALPGVAHPFFILMSFILSVNIVGLLPYSLTVSAHMVFVMSLSMPAWVGLMLYSWGAQGSFMCSHLLPLGTPSVLAPFMVLIESISTLIRPMSLSVRLCANMTAGHMMVSLISSTESNKSVILLMVFISLFLILILETGVSLVQSYVFSTLMYLYFEECNSWQIMT